MYSFLRTPLILLAVLSLAITSSAQTEVEGAAKRRAKDADALYKAEINLELQPYMTVFGI